MKFKVGDLIKLPAQHRYHREGEDVIWWANRPALVVDFIQTNELPHVGVMVVGGWTSARVIFPGTDIENCEVLN